MPEYLKGPRGGTYWLDENGKKHYVKSSKKTTKKTPKKNEAGRYICYYIQRDEHGEMVDDFKEWCDADSEAEARREFEYRYHRGIAKGTIEISHISKE